MTSRSASSKTKTEDGADADGGDIHQPGELGESAKRRRTDTGVAAGGLDSNNSTSNPFAAGATTAAVHDHSPDAREFNHYLFKVIAFKAERGNFQIPKEEFPELHQWLQTLKREYKKYADDPSTSKLTQEQLKVLEFLHIPVTSRGDDHWNRFYELLRQYGERHNHILVPRLCEVPGLGDWVTDQRRQFKAWKQGQATQLTQERREKLESIGFTWSVRSRPEWEQRYHELLQYKEKHGDCKVPQHYKPNKSLGKWVAKQREQYKHLRKGRHSFLTPYRLEKLVQAGFAWQVRANMNMAETEDELNPLKVEMQQQQQPTAANMEMAANAAAAQVDVAGIPDPSPVGDANNHEQQAPDQNHADEEQNALDV